MNNLKYVLVILGINYSALQASDLMEIDDIQDETFYDFNPQDFTHPYAEEDPFILNDEINCSSDYQDPYPSASHYSPVMGNDDQGADNIVFESLSTITDVFSPTSFDNNLALPMDTEDHAQWPASSGPTKLNLSIHPQQSLQKASRKRKRAESMSEDPDSSANNQVDESNQNVILEKDEKHSSEDNEEERPAKRQRTQDNTDDNRSSLTGVYAQTLSVIQSFNFDANNNDPAYLDNAVIQAQKTLSVVEDQNVSFIALKSRMWTIKQSLQSDSMDARIIQLIYKASVRKSIHEKKTFLGSKEKRAIFKNHINEYKILGKFQAGCNYEEIVSQLMTDHKNDIGKKITAMGIKEKVNQILKKDEIPQEDRKIYKKIMQAAGRIYERDKSANKNKNDSNSLNIQTPNASTSTELNLSIHPQQSLQKASRKRKRAESMSENPDSSANNQVEESDQNVILEKDEKHSSEDNEEERPAKRQRTQDNTGDHRPQLRRIPKKTLSVIQSFHFDANNKDPAYWDNAVIQVQKALSVAEGQNVSFSALQKRVWTIKRSLQSDSMDARIIQLIFKASVRKYKHEKKPPLVTSRKE